MRVDRFGPHKTIKQTRMYARPQRLQLPLRRRVHQLRAGLELVGDGDQRDHDLRLRVEALPLALDGGVDRGLDLRGGVWCCIGMMDPCRYIYTTCVGVLGVVVIVVCIGMMDPCVHTHAWGCITDQSIVAVPASQRSRGRAGPGGSRGGPVCVY